MTRALEMLKFAFRRRLERKQWPRPGYCQCCGAWAWLTNETPAYSAYDGAYICEECADDNDEETRLAWHEYYAGCL